MRKLLLSFISLLLLITPPAFAAFAVDAGKVTTRVGNGSSSLSLTPTGISASSVVFLGVWTLRTTTTVVTVSSVSSPTLTWTKLTSISDSSSSFVNIELWWAPSSGSIASEAITVNLSTTVNLGAMAFAMSVTGANNIASPYDSNGSATQKGVQPTGGTGATLTQSTTQSNDFLLFFTAGNASAGNHAPTGFTTDLTEGSGATSQSGTMSHKVVSAPTSSVSYVATVPSSGNAAIIAAITSDATTPPGSFGITRQPLTHW